MKKLLLAIAVALPLALGLWSCAEKKVPPKAPEAVRVIPLDNFAQRFPTPPTAAPSVATRAPVVTAPKRKAAKKALPTPTPDVVEQYETVPPVAHVSCIFPFNLIPTCTPGAIQ